MHYSVEDRIRRKRDILLQRLLKLLDSQKGLECLGLSMPSWFFLASTPHTKTPPC
jgi:hypothetical protein